MSDILVVKVNTILPDVDMENIRANILKQKDSGIIFLPNYCEALFVPQGTEIKVIGGGMMDGD